MLLPSIHDSDPSPNPSQASLLWGCRRRNAFSRRRPEPCACRCTALPPGDHLRTGRSRAADRRPVARDALTELSPHGLCTAAKRPQTSTPPRGRRPLRLIAPIASELTYPLTCPCYFRADAAAAHRTRRALYGVGRRGTAWRPTGGGARLAVRRGRGRPRPLARPPKPLRKRHPDPRLPDASRARGVESHKSSALQLQSVIRCTHRMGVRYCMAMMKTPRE